MKMKSKMLLAVMAVAIMLGCALVPLTVTNGDAQANDTNVKEFDEVDYLQIIDALREGMTDLDMFELDGITLVPAEKNEGEGIVISQTHDEPYECIDGKIYALGNNIFNDNGKIVVNTGATLQLFPLDQSQEFKLTDNYNKSGAWDRLVLLKTGSFLEIFGMTFLVINTADDENGFVLFGMDKENESSVSCTYSYDNQSADDKMTLTAKLDEANGGDAIIANVSFTPDSNNVCLDVSGTMAKAGTNGISFTDGKIKFLSEIDKDFEIMGYDGELTGKIEGTVAVKKLVATYDIDSKGNINGYFEADMSIANGKDPWLDATFTISTVIEYMGIQLPVDVNINLKSKDASLSTGEIDFEIAPDNKNMDVSITATNEIKIHANDITCKATASMDIGIPIEIEIANVEIENADIALKGLSSTITLASSQSGYDVMKANMIIEEIDVSFESLLDKMPHPVTGIECTQVLINDFRFKISSLHVNKDDKTSSVSIDEMTIETGTVSGLWVDYYIGTFDAKITDFNVLNEKGIKTISLSGMAELKLIYDGNERAIYIGLENANLVRSTKGTTVLADKVEIYKDIPNSVFTYSKVMGSLIREYGLLDYMEIEAKKVNKQADKDYTLMEYASVCLDNIDLYNELRVEFVNDVKISFENQPQNESNATSIVKVQCGEIKGSFTNIGILTEKFSITDNPEIQYEENIDPQTQTSMNALHIVKGDAKFDKGILDINIIVGKDAKFSANGASFSLLIFEKGCQKSGTITIMSFEWGEDHPTYGRNQFNSEVACVDGINVVYQLTMKSRGFTIGMSLSDLKSGTVDAKKGYTLPKNYKSPGGEYEITSDDGKTGKITIFTDVTIVDCDKDIPRNSFKLRYQDNFIEEQTYRFGDEVMITKKEPVKDGLEFIGWTDGSRSANNLIYGGYTPYIMPARDVTLKPVFMKEVVPDVKTEDRKTILVVDAHEAGIVHITSIPDNWNSMKIIVDNVTIEFDKKTYDKLGVDVSIGLYVAVTPIDSFNDEIMDNVIGNKKIYSIEMRSNENYPLEYSGETTFKVTINMKLDETVKNFSINSFDRDYGYLSNVGLDEYKRCGDGSYNVTFTVNHFSLYAIEPVYKNTLDNLFILVFIIIAIILVCAILAKLVDRKKTPE